MSGNWIDLRADDGRLYGRLERSTLQLEIVRGDRRTVFDLVSTAQSNQVVVRCYVETGVDTESQSPKLLVK